MKITNIDFRIEEYGIEFSFNSDEGGGSAILQLPNTPDSQDQINGADFDNESEEHAEIFKACKRFYYDSFNDIECAAASALVGGKLSKIVEVDGFYVAFGSKEYVLTESKYKEYYNKQALFELAEHSGREYNEKEIIQRAKLNRQCGVTSLSLSPRYYYYP
jgi:hypothetical protein